MSVLIKDVCAFLGTEFERRDRCSILIENGRITAVQEQIDARADRIIDGRSFFATPGFVNAHFHPSQQINRALGVGLAHAALMDLLHATDQVKSETDKTALAYVAVLEALKAGTTAFLPVGSEIRSTAGVFSQLGVRAACTMMPKDLTDDSKHISVRAKTWETEELLATAEQVHLENHRNLIEVHFGVCNVRYSSDRLISGMAGLSRKYKVGFHLHCAESQEYVREVVSRTGRHPISHLMFLGALSPSTTLAHAVQLGPEEIKELARHGSHVIHCPRSNAYLAVGICPLLELLNAGVNVALGSDAAINNNSNDVRGEARAAFEHLSYRWAANHDTNLKRLFSMLTTSGATALGWADKVGAVEIGKSADIVLWKKTVPPFIPGHDYLADLVFTEGAVADTVLIDGRIVLEGGRSTMVDENSVLAEALRVSEQYKDKVRAIIARL